MKKIQILLVILICCQFSLLAQKRYSEFGKISRNDINISLSDGEKSAEAIVLSDIGKSCFVREDNSFNIVFERETRIKILSEAGIKWAEVEIPYYREGNVFESIYDVEANVYNDEGASIHKNTVNTSNFHDEIVNNSWSIRKIVLPNVKVGSVIEYKYKIVSQYIFNLREWRFQWKIPVRYSEYKVSMIPFYEYNYILQGVDKLSFQSVQKRKGFPRVFGRVKYSDMVYTYVMKDVPAFNDEEFITSINDYIIKVDFQLGKIYKPSGVAINVATTWSDFINDLSRSSSFGKYVKKSRRYASKLFDVDSIINKSPIERFNFILNFIKKNYSWNGSSGKYASKSFKNFIREKHGNSADLNLFTVGLLNAVGISAKPVVSSTRGHGLINYKYPYRHYFNNVVVSATVEGKKILTDSTEPFISNTCIPSRCINDKGLLVDKGKIEWVNLKCYVPSSVETKIVMNMNSSLMNVDLEKLSAEYDALNYRRTCGDDVIKVRERLSNKGYTIVDTSIVINNYNDCHKPYMFNCNLKYEPEVIGDKIYVSPFLNETINGKIGRAHV